MLPRAWLSVGSSALLTALSAPVHADVPPPNACDHAGQACTPALDGSGRLGGVGTCTSTSCSKMRRAGDGGMEIVSYDCMLCLPNADAASVGGTPSSLPAGVTTTATPKTAATPPASGSSCAIQSPPDGAGSFGFFAGGAWVFALSRRLRRRRVAEVEPASAVGVRPRRD